MESVLTAPRIRRIHCCMNVWHSLKDLHKNRRLEKGGKLDKLPQRHCKVSECVDNISLRYFNLV